jgi:DNA-binding CsgD family transcriptional regulator
MRGFISSVMKIFYSQLTQQQRTDFLNQELYVDGKLITEKDIDRGDLLTETEREYLMLICEGLTHQEMAQRLFRSVAAFNRRRDRLLKRFECKNRPHLVATLFRLGVLK